jgi:hypothetical protein
MTRGRKRQHDATIPAHIDQSAIPRGIYWQRDGRGRWFVFDRVDGKPKRKTVATAEARLSDLHRIAEERAGVDRATLGYLLDEFHAGRRFAELAPGTRRGYEFCRRVAKAHETAKLGRLGDLHVSRITRPGIQRVVDRLAEEGTPTKANALLRYLRRVFSWGMNRGLCAANPAQGVEAAKERRAGRMPDAEVVAAIREFARLRGARKAHTDGSVAPYLWLVLDLAYLLRLRGSEVLMLTDASERPDGVYAERLKGSRATLTEWSPRLRDTWAAAVELRRETLAKLPKDKRAVTPIDPARRALIVGQSGARLSKDGLDTAWQRMMLLAIAEGVIAREQRFGLHGMKHRGVTDTKGNRADKQDAGGHRTAAMVDIYDHAVPRVQPAGE